MDMMMMEDEEVVQMVDDDEVENVGIMSGFMEDIEELMEEISEAEMNGVEEGDDADMARMMNRTPDSPEILMNNLRGDMRSIDARREELADLVGMRQAEETPEGVLALLQPVLAQQDAMAAMPMPMPAPQMPPPPMPAMPAQPAGIESITVDETVVPAMYKGGSVQNFNRGSGQMGVTPAQSMSPSGVRYYANGTPEAGVVSDRQYSPAAVASADQYIKTLLASQPSAPAMSLPTIMDKEAALYETLGLGTPKEATQAQMLFDLGQAALQFGSNVGADGQPMRGSAAARLAQVAGPLAGRIGARAGEMSKEARALIMLALQSAQNKIATAQASDAALAKQQGDIALDIATFKPPKLSAYEEKIQDLMGTKNLSRPEAVEIVNTKTFIEPNSGNVIAYNEISGEAEVIDVDFPEPPADPTKPPDVLSTDLAFDAATGTGLFAGIRNFYSSTVGQLPFLPSALKTEEAAQRLRFLERDAISSLATTTRPSVVEQARILATIPQAVDFSQNPEVAQESLANFVDLMGQVYVDDVKYSNDISNPKAERNKSEGRARAVQRTINSLLKEDASKLYFDTINNVIKVEAGEFGEMTRDELKNVKVATLQGDALKAYISALEAL